MRYSVQSENMQVFRGGELPESDISADDWVYKIHTILEPFLGLNGVKKSIQTATFGERIIIELQPSVSDPSNMVAMTIGHIAWVDSLEEYRP